MDDYDFHDAYIEAWNEATRTGDSAPVERMLSADYHGWTGRNADTAEPFDKSDALEGFRSVVSVWPGATVHANHRTTSPRGDDEAVVSYELSYRADGKVLARAFMMESWRRGAEGWRMHRDFTEHGVQEIVRP